ncbi:hypothetical protein NC652_004987 [Populus alba x Populus x berolinensis]|nr:hypothetical protein NC652_004987 [Populus alba x Populus x berolinensis]
MVGLRDMHAEMNMYGLSGYANTLLNSRHLKSVQHLLDEVVNVKKALKQPQSNKCSDDSKESDRRPSSCSMLPSSNEKPPDPTESTADSTPELSPVERQDLLDKKTKLLSMLEEVNRKYKEYYHQMQIVVLYFDTVAGHGAAKSYTALALQTISRHFRCLRDAISGQIEVIMKRLGEQGNSPNGQGGIPRLRYVDHQARQQRALQQLGVMRHAWRPQRGLPESSVSVLRAWLFEHFLHPYPSDSEKIMLARQAGLTRSQESNKTGLPVPIGYMILWFKRILLALRGSFINPAKRRIDGVLDYIKQKKTSSVILAIILESNLNFSVSGPDLRGSNTFSQSHGVLPSIKSLEERMSRSIELVQVPPAVQESEISHTRHLMDLLGAANETNHQAQSYLVPREEAREAYNLGGEQVNDDYSLTGSGFPQSSTSLSRPSTSYGTESFAVAIGNSRYLKPAQSLLEEIVHVEGRYEKYKTMQNGRSGIIILRK